MFEERLSKLSWRRYQKQASYYFFIQLCIWINEDRKSTRLNSSHVRISYAVFCLKKKNSQYYIDSIVQPTPMQNPIVDTEAPVTEWPWMTIMCIDTLGGTLNVNLDLAT